MFRRRVFWIGLVVALALAGGGYGYYHAVYLRGQEPEDTLMTAQVARGDLILSVSGSGVLRPSSEKQLGFETEGYVDEVLVEVSDRVQEGDLLARLDAQDLERAVFEAELNLHAAREHLAETTEPVADAELASARSALQSARAALTIAQYNYENAQISDLVADVRSRQIAFQYAVDRYWEAEENGSDSSTLEKRWNSWASTEYEFNKALQALEVERLEAANQLDQARNRVLQAEEDLASLQGGADEKTVLQAELRVRRAERALETARQNLTAAELRAPFAGTVVEVTAMAGQRAGTTAILTLANLDSALVQFWVEESDLTGVAVGHRVEIEFDGLPEQIFLGEVIRIDPALVRVENTLALQAWARLNLAAQQVNLFGDMNAIVEVISAEAREVVLAPVQALREIGDGQYAVFVVQPDGELALRPVEVGLKDFVNAEILSGLEGGEVVSLGQRTVSSTTAERAPQEIPGLPGGRMFDGGGVPGGGRAVPGGGP